MPSKEISYKRLKSRKNFIATPGSTATRHVNYDEKDEILEVQFPSGNIYQYLDVTIDVWKEYKTIIESGASSGKFLNNAIKDFEFVQVY